MKLIEEIENYVPYNDTEVKEKEIFLDYINRFDDVLTRKNEIIHFTSSALVLNEKRDKALMIHHNIYNSWYPPGGHADGDEDLLNVATKEVGEETGLKNIKVLDDNIFSLETFPILTHFKRGAWVSAHIHANVTYLLEASEEEVLEIKEDENSNVAWIPINELVDAIADIHLKHVYEKLIKKAKELEIIK
jgi:ADP-ribose pyrophosphatase